MRNVLVASVSLFALAGCGDVTSNNPDSGGGDDDGSIANDSGTTPDAPTSNARFSATGMISGQIPDDSVIVALWTADDGTGDYIYKFGEGRTTGNAFTIEFATEPPAMALFPDSSGQPYLGVGTLVVFPAGTVINEGVFNDSALDSSIGAAGQNAIIFRYTGNLGVPWELDFPDNDFACARCDPQAGTFDNWAPAECPTVTVTAGPLASQSFCNWT